MKEILIIILVITSILVSGCVEDDNDIVLETVTLYEGQYIHSGKLNLTLLDANAGYWKSDCTATIVVTNRDTGETETLLFSKSESKREKDCFGLRFYLVDTTHYGATIRIFI